MKSELHLGYNAPLNELNNETGTFGCRANNPDICRSYMLDGICAFVNADKMCKQPSRSWKKQYAKLKESINE